MTTPRTSTLPASLGCLLALLGPSLVQAQDEGRGVERGQDRGGLTVQRTWEVAVVGLDANPGLDVRRLLDRWEAGMERELPGLDVVCDARRYRNYPLPPGPLDRREESLIKTGLLLAAEDGLDLAAYDVVFVLTPHGQRYFGLAHVEVTDPRGRTGRGGLVHSRPFPLLVDGILAALEGSTPPGFQPPADPGLPPDLRRFLATLLRLLRAPLALLADLPGLREALLLPTLAHELGHFFAPGDPDVRDGYQRPWLQHATGPDDNPDGHGLACVLYKGRDAGFYLRKLFAIRGRLVVFCDPCRRKLGCD